MLKHFSTNTYTLLTDLNPGEENMITKIIEKTYWHYIQYSQLYCGGQAIYLPIIDAKELINDKNLKIDYDA